jgi:N6-L-threonylcarbamoyladenine synthase
MADIILGIESSCDDTSAAVIRDGYLLSNVLASQEVHKAYGGVIPELASRAHQVNIVPVVSEAISRAGIKPEDITAIAFTRGPGLLGSLLVGTSFAKGLSLALDKPLVEVNDLLENVKAAAHVLGVGTGIDPFMTLSFMALPVIPTVRLTTRGVVDVITQQYI